MEDIEGASARATEIARLRSMMAWPENRTSARAHVIDALERRIYALEHEIAFSNPFNDVDECLFELSRANGVSDDSGFVVER